MSVLNVTDGKVVSVAVSRSLAYRIINTGRSIRSNSEYNVIPTSTFSPPSLASSADCDCTVALLGRRVSAHISSERGRVWSHGLAMQRESFDSFPLLQAYGLLYVSNNCLSGLSGRSDITAPRYWASLSCVKTGFLRPIIKCSHPWYVLMPSRLGYWKWKMWHWT